MSGMEAYIPHSFSRPKLSKPWFNTACSRAIHDREVVHKRCSSLPSPESHARNHAKSVLQLAKNSFIHRKCQNLSRYNLPRDFWNLAKNLSNNFTYSSFPLLVQPGGTNAISSKSKAEHFAQTFAGNSTLDDSGLVPPSSPLSDYFMLPIKILRNDVFHAFASLNPRKAYGPDGISLLFFKTVPPCLHRACTLPSQTLSTLSIYIYLSFLLEICLHSACS